MKNSLRIVLFAFVAFTISTPGKASPRVKLFTADDEHFKYTGRVDFADPQKPKFWSPGVYITTRFKGATCELLINDEEMYDSTLKAKFVG